MNFIIYNFIIRKKCFPYSYYKITTTKRKTEGNKTIKFEQADYHTYLTNLDECSNEMLLNIHVSTSCCIMEWAGMERMYVILRNLNLNLTYTASKTLNRDTVEVVIQIL